MIAQFDDLLETTKLSTEEVMLHPLDLKQNEIPLTSQEWE